MSEVRNAIMNAGDAPERAPASEGGSADGDSSVGMDQVARHYAEKQQALLDQVRATLVKTEAGAAMLAMTEELKIALAKVLVARDSTEAMNPRLISSKRVYPRMRN